MSSFMWEPFLLCRQWWMASGSAPMPLAAMALAALWRQHILGAPECVRACCTPNAQAVTEATGVPVTAMDSQATHQLMDLEQSLSKVGDGL